MKRIKKSMSYVTFIIAAFFMSCFSVEGVLAEAAKEDTWAIYWYICGSNLESENGYATNDLRELEAVALPDNVTFVIEAGGANEWHNDVMNADMLERFIYTADGYERVDQQPIADMGDPETLTDFLTFCTQNYPSDHTAVIFWNHGGGSVYGAEFDECYDMDSLTLNELHEAFSNVYAASSDHPPIDFIGFDCCLMATIDTAATFSGFAQYMIASEEVIPQYGWDYTKWVGALAENPSMDAKELGRIICDTYLETNTELNISEKSTLSVIDLSSIPSLLEVYEQVGAEAFEQYHADSSFLTKYAKAAKHSENYGGNTPSSNFGNQVDLRNLIMQCEGIMPETVDAFLQELDKCVVYKVKGEYRQESSGLSCYFSYNNDAEEIKTFCKLSVSDSIAKLYENFIDNGIQDFFKPFDIDSELLEDFTIVTEPSTEDIPIEIDEHGMAFISVDSEMLKTLTSVWCETGFYDAESDAFVWFGVDNDLFMDWDNGIFGDNFHDAWVTIDGYMCYLDLSYQGEDYNLYYVPILLNGEEYHLEVVYDYKKQEYEILGAGRGIDENGAASRDLVQLKPGDKLTTMFYLGWGDIDAEDGLYPAYEFEVTENTTITEEIVGDGEFVMSFLLTDYQGNQIWSEPVMFIVDGDHIETGYFQYSEAS